MELNLLPILNCEGRKLPIDVTLELENRPGDEFRFLEPVRVTGQIVNVGGCLELDAKGTAALEMVCDRCAEPFSGEIAFTLEERLKKEDPLSGEEVSPDVTVFAGNAIELDALVYGGVFLSLPAKVLCREDCKGLCAGCGKNLTDGPCACDTRPSDPRFDVLDQLL